MINMHNSIHVCQISVNSQMRTSTSHVPKIYTTVGVFIEESILSPMDSFIFCSVEIEA